MVTHRVWSNSVCGSCLISLCSVVGSAEIEDLGEFAGGQLLNNDFHVFEKKKGTAPGR